MGETRRPAPCARETLEPVRSQCQAVEQAVVLSLFNIIGIR